MTITRRVHLWIEQSLDDELETLMTVVGCRQKSRLVAHLLDRALEPYRPAIIEAQRARESYENGGRPAEPPSTPSATLNRP